MIRHDTHSWLATFPQCQNNLSRLQRAEECPQVYSKTQDIFITDKHSDEHLHRHHLTKLSDHIEILDEDRQNM